MAQDHAAPFAVEPEIRAQTVDNLAAHVPVMLGEVLDALNPSDGGTFVDGTFGAGGYARGLLQSASCRVIGIDRDADALALGGALSREFPGRLTLLQGRFSQMGELLREENIGEVDGVVLDLGVSSMQLDRPERGFSFSREGPLDMRMNQHGDTPSAADVVNSSNEVHLAAILWLFGEERRSRRIARAIVRARDDGPIETTSQLAAIVERALGRAHANIHPATRTFQALRIYVNRELEELERGLAAAERLLKTGGRLVVVSFHSLEDRIVKNFLTSRSDVPRRPSRHLPELPEDGPAPSFQLVGRRASAAGADEVAHNPRARSAKMRAAVRTDAPAIPLDPTASAVPSIGGV